VIIVAIERVKVVHVAVQIAVLVPALTGAENLFLLNAGDDSSNVSDGE
jgi:hypothetical protein